MTLQECYLAMDADFDEILRRLKRESLIQRLLLMLPRDENFALLEQSLAAEDYATAFRAAHSLKGVTLNLGVTRLAHSVSELTESLRSGTPTPDMPALYEQVKADYALTLSVIQRFSQEQEQGA